MSDPSPPVPWFAWLTVSNTLAYATFGAAIPLLPLMLPAGSSLTDSSLLLVAFILPALLVHPVISSLLARAAIPLTVALGGALESVGTLALGVALASCSVANDGESAAQVGAPHMPLHFYTSAGMMRLILAAAMCISGAGAAIAQFGLVRFVDETMYALPSARKRQVVGVHLAFLEACIALGMMVSPLLFAFFATTRSNVHVPFLVSGCVQLCLAAYVSFLLRSDAGESFGGTVWSSDDPEEVAELGERSGLVNSEGIAYGSVGHDEEGHPVAQQGLGMRGVKDTNIPQASGNDPLLDPDHDGGVLHALRHPWVWVILLSMFLSASSSSFLRPLLTPRITDDLGGSRMSAAVLFSLTALVGFVAESTSSTMLSAKIGIRNAVILGLLICLGGFYALGTGIRIGFAVILIVAGCSSSIVMTVTDLSQTTHTDFVGVSNSLSRITGVTFTLGELVGALAAGMLQDRGGSFEYAVSKWHKFLTIACALVVAPYLVGICIQFLSPWICADPLRRRRRHMRDTDIPTWQELVT